MPKVIFYADKCESVANKGRRVLHSFNQGGFSMLVRSILAVLFGLLVSATASAASVTEWGGGSRNTSSSLQQQLIGKWLLVAVYEDNQDVTNSKQLNDYWLFKENGLVEHNEEPIGLRRSNYQVESRNIYLQDRRTRTNRTFVVQHITNNKLIWIDRQDDREFTYNFERY